jgi:2TM domain
MPKKVKPTGKQKSMLMVHALIFAVVTAISWMTYDRHTGQWAYPWPAWTTAAWALALLGHFCIVFTSTEDKGWATYRSQQGKEI